MPALAGLGAPHWRAEARGALFGLTRGTNRAHIARAVLDGIALQIVDLLDAMAADSGAPLQRLRVDGGAAANNLLMQIQSDLLKVVIDRPPMLEATGLGAALIAGLGAGVIPSIEALERRWSAERHGHHGEMMRGAKTRNLGGWWPPILLAKPTDRVCVLAGLRGPPHQQPEVLDQAPGDVSGGEDDQHQPRLPERKRNGDRRGEPEHQRNARQKPQLKALKLLNGPCSPAGQTAARHTPPRSPGELRSQARA